MFAGFSGCAVMEQARTAASQTVRSLRPTSSNYDDPTDDTTDPWVKQASAEGRGDRALEPSTEPAWFNNLVRSPKARDIENNLGFE